MPQGAGGPNWRGRGGGSMGGLREGRGGEGEREHTHVCRGTQKGRPFALGGFQK